MKWERAERSVGIMLLLLISDLFPPPGKPPSDDKESFLNVIFEAEEELNSLRIRKGHDGA